MKFDNTLWTLLLVICIFNMENFENTLFPWGLVTPYKPCYQSFAFLVWKALETPYIYISMKFDNTWWTLLLGICIFNMESFDNTL
jgi:hypothetical protein